ncbi:hypothetical protein H4S03_008806 [Coemansia sp. S3946]|nr:hypothetical protein H4S03_008806 [Coemansia sp. S3946]
MCGRKTRRKQKEAEDSHHYSSHHSHCNIRRRIHCNHYSRLHSSKAEDSTAVDRRTEAGNKVADSRKEVGSCTEERCSEVAGSGSMVPNGGSKGCRDRSILSEPDKRHTRHTWAGNKGCSSISGSSQA